MTYTIANYYDYERAIITFQLRGIVFMMFQLTPKFGSHLVLRTDQRRKSRTSCIQGSSVFDLLPIRTIRFRTKKFELKMLPNSNRTLVFEHSGWEPKRAKWCRNALGGTLRPFANCVKSHFEPDC